ncbi:hypothetical protein Taro_026822 [Colocasia esculenta]|uniref:Uncharacterized protein n=1 Tax=Colocasia esculenta TaxID=4460 RepID=A0A843VDY0_COLES|nr:hypothetical protein [Colocasia esculenta]
MCAGALSKDGAIASRARSWWPEGGNQGDVLASAVLTLLIIAGISSYLVRRKKTGHARTALPPGPTGLPLLGSLPFLGPDLHRSFAELAKAYGPVMSIRLGTKLCLVVSSPAAAKEVLKDLDAIFANRDVPASAKVINYGGRGIGWNGSLASWRVLRKMTVRELLNTSTVNAFYSLRRSEVRRMVREVHRMCGTPVQVWAKTSLTSLDVITNMMWGSTVQGEERSQVGKEFSEVVTEINDLLGVPNVSDLIPALARFDLQGVERRMKRLHVLCDKILSKIIDMRVRDAGNGGGEGGEEKKGGGNRGKDFLQVMLDAVESTAEAPLTVDNLKAIMMASRIDRATHRTGELAAEISSLWAVGQHLSKLGSPMGRAIFGQKWAYWAILHRC